ncbi:MAG: hypothetical protein KDE48_25455, partial [Anaerolineales bacterium]|nr:hypothetical protein [Anaerolineales bacterium]
GDIRPQNVVRKLATPFFSIPHAKEEKYDFGTGPFTVMALVSPDTTVNSPAQTTSDVKNTGEIQPGNIISKFDPCKTDDGGWSLSITADRPKWLQSIIDASISALEEEKSAKEAEKTRLEGDAQHSVADVNQLKAIIFDIGVEIVEKKTDKYLFFTLFNQDGSCKEMCAPLNNKYYIKRKHGTEIENDADESTRAGTLFKRFTHMVAIVRDSSGECHLYLNGNKLDLLKNTTSTDLVNVSNDQPLNIGSVLPTSSEIKQAGVVRKVALWKTTLTQADIVEQMNSMSEPKPGTSCVGYWDAWHLTYEDESNQAGSTERKDGKDLSAVKNDMPIDQRMTLSEVYMVLPFYMQEQENNVWCWAATSVSIRNFYKPEQPITQCQLVEKSFKEGNGLDHVPLELRNKLKNGTESCCDDAHPAKCNYGYVPAYALDIYGIKGEYVNPFPRTVKPYRKEINKWQPISLGTQSHFVITSGIYIVDRKNVDRKNVDRKKWIVINDPYYGVSTVLFETFTNNNYKYVNGEIWRNGINCTKPKPPEATVPA